MFGFITKKERLKINIVGLEAKIEANRSGGFFSALDNQLLAEAKKELELMEETTAAPAK